MLGEGGKIPVEDSFALALDDVTQLPGVPLVHAYLFLWPDLHVLEGPEPIYFRFLSFHGAKLSVFYGVSKYCPIVFDYCAKIIQQKALSLRPKLQKDNQ